MAEVLLFHHVQGLTDGVRAFADDLRAGGHTVHTPDLFAGHTFDSIDEGFAYLKTLAEGEDDRRLDEAVRPLPDTLVYAGFSYGVMAAQRLAQTRPGARGALLYEACIPISGEWAFGAWPDAVRVQVHGAGGDEFFQEDLPAAKELVEAQPDLAELFVYPGERHLFADRSLPSYDADAAALLLQRSLEFLDRVE
ncbi:MAG: dienelactone hydrolase family protein [Nocardioides sp.]|nr:dienelactone hydrolase family protein [Nocardioides sp.]